MRRRTRSLCWFLLATLPLIAFGTLTVRALIRAEAQASFMQLQAEATLAADAAAGSLLLSEAMRPSDAWRAFAQPGVIIDGQQDAASLDRWWVPSPLLYGSEQPALLHFEVRPDGLITSPQVVSGRDLIRAKGIRPATFPAAIYEQKLEQLQQQQVAWAGLVRDLPEFDQPSEMRLQRNALVVTPDQGNRDEQQSEAAPGTDEALSTRSVASKLASRQKLQEKNVELQNRYNSSVGNQASNFPRKSRGRSSESADNRYTYLQPQILEQVPAIPSAVVAPQVQRLGLAHQGSSSNNVGAMRGMWIAGELFFLRRMQTDQGDYIQGVWMDAEATAAFCAEAMSDILPGARVIPAPQRRRGKLRQDVEPMGLANLPFVVVSPSVDLALPTETTLLLWALVIAALIALIAAGLLVFLASSLADRRAAFVSAVTHELRTPLTALRLHADLLANERVGENPQRRAQTVKTLQESGSRLAALVDNVLDYARLERRRPPRSERVSVADVIQRGVTPWQQRLRQVDLELDMTQVQASPGQAIRGDSDALLRILDNLIDNACKYAHPATPAQVDLSVAVQGRWVVIAVRDYGPGLPAGKLPRPGERSAEQSAGHAPGIGLGLELCRRLAKAMGGSLEVKPQEPGLSIQIYVPSA